MCRALLLLVIFSVISLICGQIKGQTKQASVDVPPEVLRKGLSTRIGNFSLEILYNTAKESGTKTNLIMSPVTVWSVLAIMAEGAEGPTYEEITRAARIPFVEEHLIHVRKSFTSTMKYLTVNTSTVQLAQVNLLFADNSQQLERDYKDLITDSYKTQIMSVNFADTKKTAKVINDIAKRATQNKIPNLVEESGLADTQMLLASALYFKGQWTSPFNRSSTQKKTFYDANEKVLGEVNMMYNRFTYPFANMKELQARVVEIPYGVEDRLSILIMLPNPNVTLEDMFLNFIKTSLTFDTIFKELKISKDEFGEDEVDLFLPRFKIESNLRLDSALQLMGAHKMFDSKLAE